MGTRTHLPTGPSRSPCIERLEPRTFLAADAILEWNAVALQTGADDHTPSKVSSPDQGGPTRTARALAIVHAAMFDALNSIDGSYTPYLISVPGGEGASIGAAVATAAHDTLAKLYPQQRADFDGALRDSLKGIRDGQAEQDGIAIGRKVAQTILDARQNDGSGDAMSYSEKVAPGVFQPFDGEPAPLTPKWGKVDPFTMNSGSQFRAARPPGLKSAAYAKAYNEVKNFGSDGVSAPTKRTPEQTEIALYWAYDGTPRMGTPPRLYNQIARVVANQQHNTEGQNARLFALINLAMADAGIASWDTKYTYDLWRPIRGVRQVDNDGKPLDDGNPATEADPNWTPLGAPYTNGLPTGSNFTPPFPAYTSGHATFGGAVFETLKRFYGTDKITFTFLSDELNGRTRSYDGTVRPRSPRTFTSFTQASEENGQSRIYLGIHWAFDKTAGIKQGKAIANHAFNNFLRPVRRGDGGDVQPPGDAATTAGGTLPTVSAATLFAEPDPRPAGLNLSP